MSTGGQSGCVTSSTSDRDEVLLSVIIPVFDRPRAVIRAVRSVLAQEVPGAAEGAVEVIVVDDASVEPPDPALMGPGVRLIRLARNGGPSAARNAGIAVARGKLVAFLDSDDVWLPGKLSGQLQVMAEAGRDRARPVAVTCGFYHPHRSTGRLQGRMPRGADGVTEFASGCWYCPGTTVIVERSVFGIVGPYDEGLRRLEDLDWFVRFGRAGGRLLVHDGFGAIIAPSRSAGSPLVAGCCERIRATFDPVRGSGLDPQSWRALDGYLWFELGAALLDEKAHARATAAFVRAFARSPGLANTAAMFGERTDRCPEDVAALFSAMTSDKT